MTKKMKMKIGDNFTKEDLEKVDFDKMNEEGLRFSLYDDNNDWWNNGFSFCLKNGKKLYVSINPRKDEGFLLKSNKYGEFKVLFLGKILADLTQDNNDELYIINRELTEVGGKRSWEADVDDNYFVNERFCEIIIDKLYYNWSDIGIKVLEMAIEGKKFVKIVKTIEEWEEFSKENE